MYDAFLELDDKHLATTDVPAEADSGWRQCFILVPATRATSPVLLRCAYKTSQDKTSRGTKPVRSEAFWAGAGDEIFLISSGLFL